MRCAVIDIGTNSVKLLVADAGHGTVLPVFEQSKQTRLGKGFYSDHRLGAEAIGLTAQAVATFAATAKSQGANSIRVVATSAARDAINREDLVRAVDRASGLPMEIISGEQEAEWVFEGVKSDPSLGEQRLLILDLGGGSTEFVLGNSEHYVFRQSFALGTVRMMEQVRPGDPPNSADWDRCRAWLESFLNSEVAPSLRRHLPVGDARVPVLIGTGGTTSILAAMELGLTKFDRARIEQVSLSRDRIWAIQRRLWSLTLADRQKIAGLPPNRADVILFGVAVFALVMEVFGFDQVRVSTRGLRFGVLLDTARRIEVHKTSV